MSEWKNTEIGIIPQNAEVRELGDCIDLVIDHRGKTPKKLDSDWVDKGIPAISAKNIHGGRLTDRESIRYVTQEIYEQWMKEDVKKGDCFLVSEGATLGEYLYWDFDFPIVLSQRLFCLRTNSKILYSKYFYAYVTSVNFQKQVFARATGSSVGGLRQTELLRLKIPVIPIDEQILIGDLLYNLEKKQKALEEQNETLEQIAQTLFKHWFIDFEFPNADGKPYKSSGSAMFASAIGDIPEGWKVEKLGDVVSINSQSIDKNYPHKIIEYVDISSVGTGILENTTQYKLSEAPSRARRLVQHGDVIWSGVRPNRKSYLFMCKPIDNLVVSTGFIVLSPIKIPSSYLYAWVTTSMFVDYLTLNASGSAYPAVKAEHFEIAEIVLPSKLVLEKFHSLIDPMRIKSHQNSLQIQTLTKTRDSLLPKLMSGQLRVKE